MPRKPCSIDGCDREAVSRGWCHGHYQRWVRLGDVRADRPLGRRVNDICSADGCGRDAIARQLCRTHYRRLLNTGDARPHVPLRVVAGQGYKSQGYWHVPVPPELRHLTNGESPYPEHRLVMAQILGRALHSDESVHHKNGNRLDNRPENLELWTRWQPSGHRVKDRIADAFGVLLRYAPYLLAAPGRRRRFRCDGQLHLDLTT